MNSSMMSVHRVLEYLMTKAAITGELKGTTVRIPYKELAHTVGKDSNKDVDLVITIGLSWDSHTSGIKDIVAESLKDDLGSPDDDLDGMDGDEYE